MTEELLASRFLLTPGITPPYHLHHREAFKICGFKHQKMSSKMLLTGRGSRGGQKCNTIEEIMHHRPRRPGQQKNIKYSTKANLAGSTPSQRSCSRANLTPAK